MTYANIILPLPLDGLFTYTIPDALAPKVQVGVRVIVPLGKSKRYVGIVAEYPITPPAAEKGIENGEKKIVYKDILEVLDATPVLLPQQLRLWYWIADYYMSPIGDVYKAALPSGLKEQDGYRPRTELYIRLADNFRNERTLTLVIDSMKRATKQVDALMAYLQLAGVDEMDQISPQTEFREVTREELMNVTHASIGIIRALLDRKILVTYEKEVGQIGRAHV